MNHAWNNPAHRPWTTAELRLLGTMPDTVLAEKFHRTEKAIRSRRGALHIPTPKL